MSYLVFMISFGYAITLLCLATPALRYVPSTLSRKRNNQPTIPFSIIIVYRNEALALPVLLESIKQMDYPSASLEWIFVNDDSSDGSLKIIKEFSKQNPSIPIRFMERPVRTASAKKDGIAAAAAQSSYDHVITTDADCRLPEQWLNAYNNHYQKYADALLVAAPVRLLGTGFLAGIQQLEMTALQAITVGAFAIRQPFMCNGANLSFSKNAFTLVDGYSGNDHLSSGDDIFLLEKLVAENVMQCHFLKSEKAVVTTNAKTSYKTMIEQRARWARKGTRTKSMLNKLVGFHVGAMNILFILSPLLLWAGVIPSKLCGLLILIKFFTDAIVVLIGSQMIPIDWTRYFVPHFFMYPFVVLAIGLRSLGSIQWHGRTIDQYE